MVAKGAAPARVSFLTFCATQIAIDCESGYHLLRGDHPVHRGLHTFLGASAICVAVALAVRHLLPSMRISVRTALLSAAVGVVGHVIPDAIMHEDVRPFAPLSDWNPWLGIIDDPLLHRVLVLMGILGLGLWLGRAAAGVARARRGP